MRKIITFITIILTISMHGETLAKDLGKYGATYPITEEDAISQLKKAIAKYDWEKFKSKQKEKIKKFRDSLMSTVRAFGSVWQMEEKQSRAGRAGYVSGSQRFVHGRDFAGDAQELRLRVCDRWA